MPTAPPRLCPRCRQPTQGRCTTCQPVHRTTTDRARGNSNSRGYDSHWRRVIRPAFLRDNPICVLCGALATVPDHWPETRASLVARGIADPDADHRLRPLCTSCHNQHGLSYKPWLGGRGGQNL